MTALFRSRSSADANSVAVRIRWVLLKPGSLRGRAIVPAGILQGEAWAVRRSPCMPRLPWMVVVRGYGRGALAVQLTELA